LPVNPRQAARRTLRFDSLDDILADAEAVTAGPHHTTANHNAAEILWHVAYFIDKPVTGFGFTAPLPVRLLGKTLKALGFAGKPIKPGLNPPAEIERHFWPDPDLTLEQSRDYLRHAIETAREPGSMTHPSPVFGKLTDAQWRTLNRRHAELHLSFIHPE